jgi:hypothetical protein
MDPRQPYHIPSFVIGFILYYFHLLSLHSVVQYLQLGIVEFQMESRKLIARRVRWILESMRYSNSNRVVGYEHSQCVSVCTAIALLLTSVGEDIGGTCVFPMISDLRIEGRTKLDFGTDHSGAVPRWARA